MALGFIPRPSYWVLWSAARSFFARSYPLEAFNEAGLDHQFVRRKAKRFAGVVLRQAGELEQHPPGSHHGHVVVDGALAFAHARLGRLLRHRLVREDPDPDLAAALHEPHQGAAGSLDLPGGHPARLERLQAEFPEADLGAAPVEPLHPAARLLAPLGALRHQHRRTSTTGRPGPSTPPPSPRPSMWAAGLFADIDVHRFGLLEGLGLHIAAVDPHLDADPAVRRQGFRPGEIDIGSPRLGRDPP